MNLLVYDQHQVVFDYTSEPREGTLEQHCAYP